MIEILIADDHRLVRSALRGLLINVPGMTVVGEAENSEKALELAKKLNPKVIFLDIHMPGAGAFQLIRKLLRINPQFKIIIITAVETAIYPKRIIQSGALGYLTKGCSFEELLNAIKSVCANQTYIGMQVAQTMLHNLTETQPPPFSLLTEREFEIAMAIAQGVSSGEIAKNLYLSIKTISAYRSQIQHKLGINTDSELAQLAIQYGLINVDEA